MKQQDIQQRIKEVSEKICKEFRPEKIILFGSYAWGEPTEDSDIDILIIKETTASKMDRYIEVKRLLYDHKMRKEIAPLVHTTQEIQKRIDMGDDFIKDILTNGVILYDREKGRISQGVV